MQNYFDSKYIIDFDHFDFKFAWGVENVYTKEPLQDQNYIRWVAEIVTDGNDTIAAAR